MLLPSHAEMYNYDMHTLTRCMVHAMCCSMYARHVLINIHSNHAAKQKGSSSSLVATCITTRVPHAIQHPCKPHAIHPMLPPLPRFPQRGDEERGYDLEEEYSQSSLSASLSAYRPSTTSISAFRPSTRLGPGSASSPGAAERRNCQRGESHEGRGCMGPASTLSVFGIARSNILGCRGGGGAGNAIGGRR